MNYLLDTHTFLWWLDNSSLLSQKVRDIISDNNNRIFLSHVSQWEIAIKVSIGRLEFPVENLEVEMKENGFDLLTIQTKHIVQTIQLPMHHRDPFDRLLIAQAQIESLVLLSKDSVFTKYEAKLSW